MIEGYVASGSFGQFVPIHSSLLEREHGTESLPTGISML